MNANAFSNLQGLARLLAGAAVGMLAMTAHATDVSVASFNLAWVGTEADFQRHMDACSSHDVNWCDTRPRNSSPEEQLRAAQCQDALEDASGGPAAALLVAPCNAYKLARSAAPPDPGLDLPALYRQKLDGLTTTVARLIEERKVDVIAFQEVRSAEVIRLILGRHADEYDACVASHTAFQTVGFAWRKSVTSQPGRCVAEPGLSIRERPDDPASLRRLRPGLGLNLVIDGNPVAFLNVHLKSACANLRSNGRWPGHELTDADPACAALNRQVVPLEDWIERTAAATPRFVVLGDFNRRLDEEAREDIPPDRVRADGSDPAGPNRTGPTGEVTTRVLWQEISDGKPSLTQVPDADPVSGCHGFEGLDHILLSDALAAVQTAPLGSTRVPLERQRGQKIMTSDHCPRVTRLGF